MSVQEIFRQEIETEFDKIVYPLVTFKKTGNDFKDKINYQKLFDKALEEFKTKMAALQTSLSKRFENHVREIDAYIDRKEKELNTDYCSPPNN